MFFSLCRRFKNQTFVTSMSLRDIEYFAHKIYHDKEKSLKLLFETYSLCSKVIGISADAAIEAIYSNMNDFEDCLQSMAASEVMLDCIVTNNVKDYITVKKRNHKPEGGSVNQFKIAKENHSKICRGKTKGAF